MTKRTLGCALAALAMSGCTTDNRNAFLPVTAIVLGTVTPVTDAAGVVTVNCVFDPTVPETELPLYAANGTNNQGSVGVVVANQIAVPTTVNTVFSANTTIFSPHQAVIDYEFVGGTQSIGQQIVPVSGTSISAGNSQSVVVPLFLPTAAATALKAVPATGAVLRVSVRIEGKLDDDSTVSTSEHEFVVAVSSAAGVRGSNSPCF
jgi:hypothetical protein